MSQQMLFEPGERVGVELTDGGNGLPAEGDVVEIASENADLTAVQKVSAQGNEGIGTVIQAPSDEDGNAVAGEGTILVAKPVIMLTPSGSATLSAGDEVQEDAGGTIVGYDGATTQTSTPLGQVFAADGGKFGYGKIGRVAVALYR